MEIKYSRHAKRRMKLYGISENIVESILEKENTEKKNTIVKEIQGFAYPVKVVFERKMNHILIITVYPLKRGYK